MMMRSLAEYVMRGRIQACFIAFIGLPMLSPAAAALVALRIGMLDAVFVSLALVVPYWVVLYVMEFDGAALLFPKFLGVALVLVGAMVLRTTRAWSSALVSVSLAAIIGSWLFDRFVNLKESLISFTMWLSEQDGHYNTETTVANMPEDPFIIGSLGVTATVLSVAVLIIARWWQSLLYNPGGFQQEFHMLRIEPKLALLCMGTFLLLSSNEATRGLVGLALVPFLFGGLGLIHGIHGQMRKDTFLIWLLYTAMFLERNVIFIVAMLGALDSAVDLRKRYKLMQ